MNLQTKQDFTALAMRFLSPLLPLYSPGGALLLLGMALELTLVPGLVQWALGTLS